MEQLTLSFPAEKGYHHDNFILHQGNRLAHQIISQWPKTWGVPPYPNILILEGAHGVGKTYHANLFAQLSGAFVLPHNKLITQEDCKYYKAFVIDDIDQDWQEQLLFHNLNICWQYAKYMLLTTSTDINNIALPDLKSRLKSVHNIKLELPDLASLKQMIFSVFANKSLKVSMKVIDYMLTRLPRDMSVITRYINLIEQETLRTQSNITVPLIKNLLEEHLD